MKVLLVYDLADHSTREVGEGMRQGFTFLGHDVRVVHTNVLLQLLAYRWKDVKQSDWPPALKALIYGAVNDLILAQALKDKPDLLMVISGWAVAPQVIRWANENGIQTALYLTESPYLDREQMDIMQDYGLVLLNERSTLDAYQRNHDHVAYMSHSFNPEIHFPRPVEDDKKFAAYMCATGFRERIALLEGVPWYDLSIDLRLEGFWPGMESTGLARHCVNEPRRNVELPAYYSSARINLNIHRTSRVWTPEDPAQKHIDCEAWSLGPRVYEILACGGFLLTDYRRELDDSGLGDGVVTFAGARDLEEKVVHYLGQPEARAEVAARGLRAVQGCTFARRIESIVIPALQHEEVSV